ncbi:hypothetical protein BDV97DRAFT_197295 [Delphinella strobiligena]|nr:hypothetical protein BDV97DRAFT_197295 [Delphinella strobiligena]
MPGGIHIDRSSFQTMPGFSSHRQRNSGCYGYTDIKKKYERLLRNHGRPVPFAALIPYRTAFMPGYAICNLCQNAESCYFLSLQFLLLRLKKIERKGIPNENPSPQLIQQDHRLHAFETRPIRVLVQTHRPNSRHYAILKRHPIRLVAWCN